MIIDKDPTRRVFTEKEKEEFSKLTFNIIDDQSKIKGGGGKKNEEILKKSCDIFKMLSGVRDDVDGEPNPYLEVTKSVLTLIRSVLGKPEIDYYTYSGKSRMFLYICLYASKRHFTAHKASEDS